MPADGFWLGRNGAAHESSCAAPRAWGRGVVVGGGGVAVTVRLDERTLRALMERAALEGIGSRSDAIRAAVREWTHAA